MSETIVTIFGTSRAAEGEPLYELARNLGRALAKAGYTIANGGYGGTMLAAARGASEAGGQVIGVTCSAFKRSKPNQYVTREVRTDCLDSRLDKLIELGAAYITLPGGTGTLLELAKVWELRNKHFSDPARPIILVGRYWRPLVELLATDDPDSSNYVEFADEPEQVVSLIEKQR